ncbi:UvrD-helicase domain-containing protein [Halobacillus trueperi]|uniref:UvrD-helicase domain-containing protein n=1 Tax=Halobacillus trueperi TaxID=156205 RepID=UPI003735CA96
MNKSIALADSYFDSYDSLDKKSRRIARSSMKQFALNERGNGFQVHDLKRINCDKSFRSARINQDLRMIFSQKGNQYIVLYIGHHDSAYDWAVGKYLNTNSFGALYLHNENIELQKHQKDPLEALIGNKTSLLELQGINQKDLMKLGINKTHSENMLEISNEDKFIEFISLFTEEMQEGLMDLVTGSKNLTQVYADFEDKENKNETTIESSLSHKNSKRRFYVIEDIGELDFILNEDLERWKVFLHPKQEYLVTRSYNGPSLVEGGPGTGKTVVGIHRAVHLSKYIYKAENNHKILFCTYSKKLSSYINEKVSQLTIQKQVDNNIHVTGIDRLINELIIKYKLTDKIVNQDTIKKIFEQTYKSMELTESMHFLLNEYTEVVQKLNVNSLGEYLKVDRSGRGKALSPRQRGKIWCFFAEFMKRKENQNLIDFEDRAHILFTALKENKISPEFESIIVDEAQDLSPVKLKLLYCLLKTTENNFMILCDQNQRIFNFTSWKKDFDINLVGRSNHLSLNYRTTKQIREYADLQFIRSKILTDHIKEYKSLMVGPKPDIKSFENVRSQYNYIVRKIKELLSNGLKPYEIGIITPFGQGNIAGVLEYEGIKNSLLKNENYPKEGLGVGISSLSGVKGLEFRVVIIANYTDISSKKIKGQDDEFYVNSQIKRIECLKYVAATRAREELIITMVEQMD